MVRTMIYLPETLHRGLKHLAIERGASLTSLVRESVEVLYREDLEDLKISGERLRDYLRHPEKAVPYSTYRRRRIRHAA